MKTTFASIVEPRVLRGALVVLALVTAAACRDNAKGTADSTLAKDLALAGQQTATPTFQDTAVSPAPVAAKVEKKEPPAPVRVAVTKRPEPKVETPPTVQQAPAPAPVLQAAAPAPVAEAPAAAPSPAMIGAGAAITMTSGTKVCTTTNMVGDKLVATVNSPVDGANGGVIPAGSTVVLEVAAVTPGQDAQSARILFKVRSVVVNDKTYNVDGDVSLLAPLDKSKVEGDPNGTKKKVIGGAIAGAILGQMIGHNTKGTVIGAAAGAATGAAVSKSGETWQACLPAGAPLKLTLNSQLVL